MDFKSVFKKSVVAVHKVNRQLDECAPVQPVALQMRPDARLRLPAQANRRGPRKHIVRFGFVVEAGREGKTEGRKLSLGVPARVASGTNGGSSLIGKANLDASHWLRHQSEGSVIAETACMQMEERLQSGERRIGLEHVRSLQRVEIIDRAEGNS